MDRVELFLALKGETPPLGSYEDVTLRNYMIQDRTRRVTKAKLLAAASATKEQIETINKYLKEYINAEYRIEDFIVETDTKLKEEFDLLKGRDLVARATEDGGIQVKVSDFYDR